MLRKFILFMFASFAIPFFGIGDVLLWGVKETTKVDGGDIQLFLVPYPSTEDTWTAARVKLVSSDGTTSTILKIWRVDPDTGQDVEWDGDWGEELMDTGSGYWGAGNPTGVQSDTGHNTIRRAQDMFSEDPPALETGSGVMESLFVMELGYNSWDDDVGDYVWQTLAQSVPELYQNLVRQHMYATGDIAPFGMNPWTPDFYTTTPEPSTELLVLVGSGVLLLGRRSF